MIKSKIMVICLKINVIPPLDFWKKFTKDLFEHKFIIEHYFLKNDEIY